MSGKEQSSCQQTKTIEMRSQPKALSYALGVGMRHLSGRSSGWRSPARRCRCWRQSHPHSSVGGKQRRDLDRHQREGGQRRGEPSHEGDAVEREDNEGEGGELGRQAGVKALPRASRSERGWASTATSPSEIASATRAISWK